MALHKFPLMGLLLLLTIVVSPATADGPVCPPTTKLSRASFPEGFLFGTATAAYQVEGAVNETCRGPSLWDIYCKRFPSRCNYDNGDVAVDFFHRYKEDIQLMKNLNTDAFRMSIAWPRIFPHGRKEKGVSQAGVQFYHDLIDELKRNGITPFVTVFHWDTPQDLEDEYGGFLSERIVKDFREYADFVFQEYGGKVKHWITFNEPWVFSHAGYDVGKKAPGRCSKYVKEECHEGRSGFEAYLVTHNLLNSHAEAVEAFRQCEKCKGGKIGIAHSPAWFEPHDLADSQDGASIDRALDFILGWHLDTTMYGDYPQIMKDIVGHRLPKFTDAQKAKLKNSADFVGLNYYTSVFSNHLEKPDPSKPRWMQDSLINWETKNAYNYSIGSKPITGALPVFARGFRSLLKYIKDKYGNPEIMIMENGYGEELGATDSVAVGTADHNRKYYLQRHLLSMNEAICIDKVNVTGYFVWSLLDNFEWQDGYKNRFGLYYIDFKNNLTRYEKESGTARKSRKHSHALVLFLCSQSSNKTMSSDSSAPKSVTVEEMAAEEDAAIEERYSLYEAYNELHALAQELETPFEAPAVLVVGQQTDGKSALVEALMGFQFNHVGGGTKTRRPITLHMKYDPQCQFPLCHLGSDDDPSVALPKSLSQIQAYIEAENMRLEQEPSPFSAKEIIVKVQYKYCPNLTIIDTPGLIAPAPGLKNRALQVQARAVEALVRAKMQHKEFIILCLEDSSDWSIATTRRIVMQVDPELSRTIVVSTKLDTKIPQFSCSSDVEVFLSPPASALDSSLLGDSPFFTSVPSGRVGYGHDSVYKSNDEFKQAVSLREIEDIASLEKKLGRVLTKQEKNRIGVSKLRLFLEELLWKRYKESVPLIIPLLGKEYRSTVRKLDTVSKELSSLDEAKLKERGRTFHDLFLTKLSLLLKGTVVAPPDKFGETLQDERTQGGSFVGTDGLQFPHKLIPNAGMRLYGGAQYHRAMAEFRFLVGAIKCPPITREEIVNACGVEDIHDGTNYSRTACVIAVAKARDTFEPFLHQLGARLLHILKRLLPISVYLLQKEGEYLSGHEVFLKRVASAFNSFVESTEKSCRDKCMEDLASTTRYVTWSLHNKNRAGLRQFLDSFGGTEQVATSGNPLGFSLPQDAPGGTTDTKSRSDVKLSQLASNIDSGSSLQTTETRLADLLDSTLWNRKLAPSSERIVYALVQQIFQGIREYFLASAELKFNCFLLMPIVDKLPALLREELENAFEDDLDSIFDITNLRQSLDQKKRSTEIELRRIKRIKEKFRVMNEKLNSHEFAQNLNPPSLP